MCDGGVRGVSAPHGEDTHEEGEGRYDHLPRLRGAELAVVTEHLHADKGLVSKYTGFFIYDSRQGSLQLYTGSDIPYYKY